MADVDVYSRASKQTSRRYSHLSGIVSRQNFPDLRIESGPHSQGKDLKIFSFIEFELPTESLVTLQLFDNAGQEVLRLLHDVLFHAGIHQITFSPESGTHAPHLYRLCVKSEGKVCVDVKRLR